MREMLGGLLKYYSHEADDLFDHTGIRQVEGGRTVPDA
jgi:hypothetical protein